MTLLGFSVEIPTPVSYTHLDVYKRQNLPPPSIHNQSLHYPPIHATFIKFGWLNIKNCRLHNKDVHLHIKDGRHPTQYRELCTRHNQEYLTMTARCRRRTHTSCFSLYTYHGHIYFIKHNRLHSQNSILFPPTTTLPTNSWHLPEAGHFPRDVFDGRCGSKVIVLI